MQFMDKVKAWLAVGAPADFDEKALDGGGEPVVVPIRQQEKVMAEPTPAPAASEGAEQRVSELEAQNRALRASLEQHNAALGQATEKIAAMERQARHDRFLAEVTGRSDASGLRWYGEPAKHVAVMEALADAQGEESEPFRAYVTQNRALAEQARTGKLLAEVGTDSRQGTGDSAWDRIEAKAAQLRASKPDLTQQQAIDEVLGSDSALYADYRAETPLRATHEE